MRDECRKLSREELDLIIMGELRALTVRDSTIFRSADRVRTSSRFEVGGHCVCIKTFCFMHNIGRGKLTAIKNSWLQHRLRPRWKPSFTPSNTTSLAYVELVVRFILHYAEDNAIFLPGRIPGYKRDNLQLLPSAVTKRKVWGCTTGQRPAVTFLGCVHLLLVVDSTGCCVEANDRLVLDMPEEQHSHNALLQQTYREESSFYEKLTG